MSWTSSNGTLTGFGGGLSAKKWLLEHESSLLRRRYPIEPDN